MITLITGTPGAGKTLAVVEELVKIRDSDDPKIRSRLIFTNVNGLDESLACVPFDEKHSPLNWMALPQGSMIIVDECQDFWPARPAGSKAPESVAAMNTHRHHGIDLLLLSQHPGLVDHGIRALVGRHRHGYRPRNLEHAIWSEWSYCEMACQPKLKPIKEKKKFNKDFFFLYKSTVENTHQPQSWWPIIKKLIPFAALLVIGAASAASGFARMAEDPGGKKALPGAPVSGAGTPAPDPGLPAAGELFPVLEYHGWQKIGDQVDFLLCLPAVESDSGPGCSVDLFWSDVAAYEVHGTRIRILASDGQRILFVLNDPQIFLDAASLGVKI